MHAHASLPGPFSRSAARPVTAGSDAARHARGPVATRRLFLGGSAATVATLPLGGVFAGGGQRLRVGLVGCGGRGTGAALQAVAADPAVRVVALGDLFADQIASAAEVLGRRAGAQFDCPPARRFVGEGAFRDVIAGDVDLVLLAGPPHVRPAHLEAAVAAGRHVYCEKPVAVDAAGAVRAAASAARGKAAGLSLLSGFCFRRDAVTRELVTRIHGGEIGRVLELHAHAAIGLPWRKSAVVGDHAAAWRQRNWISFASLSGGHFVEHHVEAVDRALWILGDVLPYAVEPPSGPAAAAAVPVGDCAARTAVRYLFADGLTLESSIDRRERGRERRIEVVVGTEGLGDLRRGSIRGAAAAERPVGLGRHQAAMNELVRGIVAGGGVHDGEAMCRSTLVAVMGRTAAEERRRITWDEFAGGAVGSARPV